MKQNTMLFKSRTSEKNDSTLVFLQKGLVLQYFTMQQIGNIFCLH